MEKWGNNRVNAIFEGNLPPNFRRPSESGPISELKRFIRDKYEYRRFKIDESQVPPPKKEESGGGFGQDQGFGFDNDQGFGRSNGNGSSLASQAAPQAKPAAFFNRFF